MARESVLHTARFDLAPCWHYLSVAPGRGNQQREKKFATIRSPSRYPLYPLRSHT